jgi:hypothetical protein
MIRRAMRPRVLVLVCLLAALLAGGALSAYWLWSAARLEQGIAAWSAEQRARGYEIAYRGPAIGGYPFALTARFEAPRIASPKGWRWQGPTVTGRAAIWSPLEIALDFSGRHRVIGPRDAPAEAEAARATAVLRLLRDGRVERAEAEARGATLRRDGRVLSAEGVTARLGPRRPAEGTRPRGLALAGAARGIVLPEESAGPLGPSLRRLDFEGVLLGEVPPGEGREMLARWRDDGGGLEIGRLALEWGPLALEGKGSLGLDQGLRPAGEIASRISGLSGTLDRLVAARLVTAERARLVKLALFALADGTDGQGRPVVALPITLQGGRLYLGPAPVLRLSPVL